MQLLVPAVLLALLASIPCGAEVTWTYIEDFEGSLATVAWRMGAGDEIVPAGGNPGAFLHDPAALTPLPVDRGPDAVTALRSLERMFSTHVSPDHVAAIVVEPQQGEGGFIPADPAFMRGLRELCDEHGILLVADEVQTGFGRTGRMFAMEHFDVEPDLMIVAKSLAGGLPLSGVVGRADIMDGPHPGAIGGTFIGNPVALAAASAVLDVFAEEQLVARPNVVGDTMRSRMLAWQSRWPRIGDVRGHGAMLAIGFERGVVEKTPG